MKFTYNKFSQKLIQSKKERLKKKKKSFSTSEYNKSRKVDEDDEKRKFTGSVYKSAWMHILMVNDVKHKMCSQI